MLNIGLIGGGTVGGGVVELLKRVSNPAIQISKICVRDINKKRDFVIDSNTTLTTSVDDVLNDANINCIVEVMGGTGLAKDVVLRSLAGGKHVVTANKALIAEHMTEIQSAIDSAPGSPHFAYEASTCGAIPIINTLQTCYVGDVIHEVMGIANGTTNFMLCKMEEGADYGEVLKEAQELGYAEADPTADVEGHDVRAKISILAKLAFGTTVPISSIPTQGISSLTAVDFEYAATMGCTIKLVGTAARTSEHSEHDGPLCVYVAPKMVSLKHTLATARGAGNAVVVTSTNLGEASYKGPGAGRYPTANSVVADIVRISDKCQPKAFPKESEIKLNSDFSSMFYIRVSIQDGLGIMAKVGELAEKNNVSINSVLQNSIVDRESVDFVITTEQAMLSEVEGLAKDLEGCCFVKKAPLVMPIISEELGTL